MSLKSDQFTIKNEYTCGSSEFSSINIDFFFQIQRMEYCPDIFCPLGLGKTVVEGVNTVVKAITDKTNTVTNALKPHSHPTIYRHPTKVGHYKRNSIPGI